MSPLPEPSELPRRPSVLVACAANICRSPAAAKLLSDLLRDTGVDATVTSAGVTAIGDRPVCDLAMSLVGVYSVRDYPGLQPDVPSRSFAEHRSRRLTAAMAAEVDLIVVMEEWQVEQVQSLNTGVPVRLLGAAPIPDPHAIGYQAHSVVFAQLRAAVRALAGELADAAQGRSEV